MKNTDTPSIERLKTCPFCEHEDELLVLSKGAGGETWHEVYCDHCCASGPANPTRAEAIAGWNTRATLETLPSAGEGVERPIPMLLYCPKCGLKHVDEPEERLSSHGGLDPVEPGDDHWTNPPHRSHLCHGCGCIWRPADVPTNGVEQIETQGKADTFHAEPFAITASPPEQPDIEGRHCNRCAEDLAPTQMLCPLCDNPSVPLSEARSRPDITRELLASKRPYAVFDYYSDVDGVPDQQNFMVSTLSPPQHPVALCGPDRKFADALCAMLNSLSLPTTEIRREADCDLPTAEDVRGILSRPSFDKWDYAAAALADARCAK